MILKMSNSVSQIIGLPGSRLRNRQITFFFISSENIQCKSRVAQGGTQSDYKEQRIIYLYSVKTLSNRLCCDVYTRLKTRMNASFFLIPVVAKTVKAEIL